MRKVHPENPQGNEGAGSPHEEEELPQNGGVEGDAGEVNPEESPENGVGSRTRRGRKRKNNIQPPPPPPESPPSSPEPVKSKRGRKSKKKGRGRPSLKSKKKEPSKSPPAAEEEEPEEPEVTEGRSKSKRRRNVNKGSSEPVAGPSSECHGPIKIKEEIKMEVEEELDQGPPDMSQEEETLSQSILRVSISDGTDTNPPKLHPEGYPEDSFRLPSPPRVPKKSGSGKKKSLKRLAKSPKAPKSPKEDQGPPEVDQKPDTSSLTEEEAGNPVKKRKRGGKSGRPRVDPVPESSSPKKIKYRTSYKHNKPADPATRAARKEVWRRKKELVRDYLKVELPKRVGGDTKNFKVDKLFGSGPAETVTQETVTQPPMYQIHYEPQHASDPGHVILGGNVNGNTQENGGGSQVLVDGMIVEDVASFELVESESGGGQELYQGENGGGGGAPAQRKVTYYSRKGGSGAGRFSHFQIDTDETGKPKCTYTDLIEKALQEREGLTVSEIYNWISSNYPYFKPGDDRWKNSVRHNLSINPYFKKGKKSKNGAGHTWTISEECRNASLDGNDGNSQGSKEGEVDSCSQNSGSTTYHISRDQRSGAFESETERAIATILADFKAAKARESTKHPHSHSREEAPKRPLEDEIQHQTQIISQNHYQIQIPDSSGQCSTMMDNGNSSIEIFNLELSGGAYNMEEIGNGDHGSCQGLQTLQGLGGSDESNKENMEVSLGECLSSSQYTILESDGSQRLECDWGSGEAYSLSGPNLCQEVDMEDHNDLLILQGMTPSTSNGGGSGEECLLGGENLFDAKELGMVYEAFGEKENETEPIP